jgi:hydroxymethylpyrimidine pyrophosphatase-like HAD family hydrolase
MFFHPARGIIALDIDGTVTAQIYELDSNVINALDRLVNEGWLLIFITGRPFQWGVMTLKPLPFTYALAIQNGALLFEMPSRKILIRKYLTQKIIPKLEIISKECETDFVIYSGPENDDWCYYRAAFLPAPLQNYGLQRAAFLGEKWQSLQTFSDLPINYFSSVKFFAQDKRAFMISQRLEKELGLHAPPNRDPFNLDFFVIQATHPQATKGLILKEFIQEMNISGPIIAAGDDHNDRSMLQVAHVKIVMANAPSDLLAMADIIAPPASQQGIIQGLREAINYLTHLTQQERHFD